MSHTWIEKDSTFTCRHCSYRVAPDPTGEVTGTGSMHVPAEKTIYTANKNMKAVDAEFATIVWGIKCNSATRNRGVRR